MVFDFILFLTLSSISGIIDHNITPVMTFLEAIYLLNSFEESKITISQMEKNGFTCPDGSEIILLYRR